MSPGDERDPVCGYVERCRESLELARKLAGEGYYDVAASRAYYAAFYAATAVLTSKGMEFSRHKGVISAVHRELVHAGKLSPDAGKALASLFHVRGVGDYGGLARVSPEEARTAVSLADSFVEEILHLLEEQ